MPFGLTFGALFFGVLCGALGLRFLVQPQASDKLAGACLLALGLSLALGLLTRRLWARWTGAACALLLSGASLRLVAQRGEVLDHVVFLAAAATAILLLVPRTGDPRRGSESTVPRRGVGVAGWVAVMSLAGLVSVSLWAGRTTPGTRAAASAALPPAAIARPVEWSSFDQGLARAREADKPVLATFITDWCPYCKKMSRETWKTAAVAERLVDVVPVRVNVEEGASGEALAARYGIQGFPVQLLLDAEGRIIARHDGYQSPREFMAWIDRALPGRAGASPRPRSIH